jgi:hypothetical protein
MGAGRAARLLRGAQFTPVRPVIGVRVHRLANRRGQSGIRPSDVSCRPSLNPASYGEDLMAAKRKWSDLSDRSRKLIITVAVAEGILKVAALIDIKRRPASQIRGPKWLWAPVVAVVNSAGVVPISYFVFGRRQPPSQPD